MEKWIRSRYQPNLPLYPGKYVTCCDEHISISLEAAREGMVLLKNEEKLLPLSPGGKLHCLARVPLTMSRAAEAAAMYIPVISAIFTMASKSTMTLRFLSPWPTIIVGMWKSSMPMALNPA